MRLAAVDKGAMRNFRRATSMSIRRRFLLVVVSVLACVPPAHAGDGLGKVEIEHVGFGSGLVYFYTTSHTNIPACNGYRKRWALTTTTAEGKAQYAFLVAAELSGKDVRVWGTGECALTGNSETVNAVGSIIDYSQHPN